MGFLDHLPARRRGKRFPVHPGLALAGLAAGAAAAALFSPRGGGRRRALVAQKTAALARSTAALGQRGAAEIGSHARVLLARARSAVHERRAPDEILCARVRGRVGRLTSHPGAVEVVAHDGVVELRGPVLAAEANRVVAGARRVLGVRGVTDLLERHADPSGVPSLQGGEARERPGSALAREHWTPGTRLLALAAGAGLATAGLSARIPGALTVSAMGALLTLRGATNLPLSRLLHPRTVRPRAGTDEAGGGHGASREG
ncbi:MAG TPA: BON domain-containing protein [Anaeromyxobacter sp.]|nr:BON domain-containing protein [Anaeromyxobacter sp.]